MILGVWIISYKIIHELNAWADMNCRVAACTALSGAAMCIMFLFSIIIHCKIEERIEAMAMEEHIPYAQIVKTPNSQRRRGHSL